MPDETSPAPESHRAVSYDAAVLPRDVKLKRAEQMLHIEWQDGHKSEYKLGELRRVCPCATCRTERDKQKATLLPILRFNPSSDIRVTDAKLVGQYAIQFTWSDGHDTGIFDYRFLRSLDSG